RGDFADIRGDDVADRHYAARLIGQLDDIGHVGPHRETELAPFARQRRLFDVVDLQVAETNADLLQRLPIAIHGDAVDQAAGLSACAQRSGLHRRTYRFGRAG